MKKIIIGCDPGASGGIAARCGRDILTRKLDGNLHELALWINGLRYKFEDEPPVIYIEEVPKYVGRNIPSSSSFTLGKSFGELLGLSTGLGLRIERVRPQEWQKDVGAGSRKEYFGSLKKCDTTWKNHLKSLACDYFPTVKVRLWNADALLLLEYGTKREF